MDIWRLIEDGCGSGAENMAVDEALAISLEVSGGAPLLRLYGWEAPAITFGYLQDATCYSGFGIPMVRRITGGGALLHDREITYSVVAQVAHPLFSGGVLSSCAIISNAIVDALKDSGIDASIRGVRGPRVGSTGACFASSTRCEVVLPSSAAGGGKIAGSAQRRFKRAFLQHGSIIFDIDEALTSTVFGEEVLRRMASIRRLSGVTAADFKNVFIRKFSERLGAEFVPSGLDPSEAALAERLVREKYSKAGWNHSSGGRAMGIPASHGVRTPLNYGA